MITAGLPVLRLVSYAYMPSPLPRQVQWSLFARNLHRLRPSLCNSQVGSPAIIFSGPAQRLLTLRPARSRSRLATLSIESSDSLVASAAVSIATGWSEPVPGREFHPLKSSAFHGALLHQLTVAEASSANWRRVRLRFPVGIAYSIILSMRGEDSEQEHRREGNDATLRELATVQTFRLPSEAMVAKAMLESAGIECFLADDHAASILGSNIAGVRMQVSRVDADVAMVLLHQPIPDDEDNALDGCERTVRTQPSATVWRCWTKRRWVIVAITSMALIAAGILVRIERNHRRWAKSAAVYRSRAERGDARSQFELGAMYYYGNGVSKDYVEAVRWYRKSAEQGDADAQYSLALMYHDGKALPQNDSEAASWCRRAAEQGNARAQDALGIIYSRGQGVPVDYAEAVRWYGKSAEQRYPQAQYDLGYMYYYGYGVQRDRVQAHDLFQEAAAQGNEEAKRALECSRKGISIDPGGGLAGLQ
jgi:TPR repeat protein